MSQQSSRTYKAMAKVIKESPHFADEFRRTQFAHALAQAIRDHNANFNAGAFLEAATHPKVRHVPEETVGEYARRLTTPVFDAETDEMVTVHFADGPAVLRQS